MKTLSWAAQIAAVAALFFVSNAVVARTPDNDENHRSELRAKLRVADGGVRSVVLQGVGCPESMCSRVRARNTKAASIWLDGLASVSHISQDGLNGPVQATFRFKDGTERTESIAATNRVLYIQGWLGITERLDQIGRESC